MSIDAISSSSASSSPFKRIRNDFQSLSQALQTGNLSAAQSVYASIQQDQQNGPQPPAGSPLANDFNAIGKALQSGDISGAQQALTSVQGDLQTLRQARGTGRGSHKGGGGGRGEDPASALDGSSSADASKTVANETTTTNPDGTITVTTTYTDGTTSSDIETNPNPPATLSPLAPNRAQWATLLNAQEQASQPQQTAA